MKKPPVVRIIICLVVYLGLFLLGASSGAIHPACFAYAGTVLAFCFAFVYFFVAANMRCFGAAALLNVFVLVLGLLAGEGNPPLIIGLLVLAALAEIVRKANGYDTRRGVRRSFIPLAFSFWAFSAHWWTDTAGSLAEAVEEMPAGYADKMAGVIANTPLLVVMLILTAVVAVLAIRLAERAMKRTAENLE
ncbi:MAG: MptD family putative ECF transporter S component [Lachnospiraceae bacterium]|nr:MptD family putative ECF transporter S component [Lachnospiraceae bacterium]